MKEEARYKENETKYDPANETFGDFLKNLKKTAKQVFGDKEERHFLVWQETYKDSTGTNNGK